MPSRPLLARTAALLLLVAACGGDDGGSSDTAEAAEVVTLADWVERADAICGDVGDQVGALAIEGPADVLANGDEAVRITGEGLDQINEIDLPNGDDGEAATQLVDALAASLELQRETLAAIGDGRDELALVLSPLLSADDVEAGIAAGEAVDSERCLQGFQERQTGLDQLTDLVDQLGPVADITVGDCVVTRSQGAQTDVEEIDDCVDPAVSGEVVATVVSEETPCPAGSELIVTRGVGLCISR